VGWDQCVHAALYFLTETTMAFSTQLSWPLHLAVFFGLVMPLLDLEMMEAVVLMIVADVLPYIAIMFLAVGALTVMS